MPARSGLARFKVVIAATREGVQLHPSIESLPKHQQKEAREALEGELGATLLIADRTGLDRMKKLMGQVEGKAGRRAAPMSVTRQVGLAFLGVGTVMLGLLAWAWFR